MPEKERTARLGPTQSSLFKHQHTQQKHTTQTHTTSHQPAQVAMPEKERTARKRRQQAPRTVTNVHLPQLFQGAAPETIDS